MMICDSSLLILSARRIWRDYCFCADALVFLVDGSQRDRFAEAQYELEVCSCSLLLCQHQRKLTALCATPIC